MHQIFDNITTIKVIPRRPRRRRGSYRLPIGHRAAAAADMVEKGGVPVRYAAGLFGVCPAYVAVARKLSGADLWRLAHGELKLADLHRDRLRHLAKLRPQRLAAAREAAVQATRERQDRTVDDFLEDIEINRVVDRIVTRFGPERLMAALDIATAPQLVAAE